MLTGTALKIVRSAHGLEPPPALEDLEQYINKEMPGDYRAILSKVACSDGGREITVCDSTGEIVHRFYSCSPLANTLSTVKWLAGHLEPKPIEKVVEDVVKISRQDPLHAIVEERIRDAANGIGEPPGLRTMADFIDDHIDGCQTELAKGQCEDGGVHLKVLKDGQIKFEITSCLPGSDRRKLAKWITNILDR